MRLFSPWSHRSITIISKLERYEGAALGVEAKNTVFRDNIRGNRLIPVSREIVSIINTPAFQRLRFIRQNGLVSYVFPTSEHTRFSHSVGVYATAREVFAAIAPKAVPLGINFPGLIFDADAEKAFSVAALCHDIGHTAYSHALEGTLLPCGYRKHEACTLHLLHTDKALRKAINNVTDIEEVILFIERNHPNRALASLISGPFDVDRCDYLERDNIQAGVRYGEYDFQWLLHSIGLALNGDGQPILLLDGPRGIDALRQFMDARRQMYRHVYYHHAVRSAQLLLKAIFSRILDKPLHRKLLSAVPPGLQPVLDGRQTSVENFLSTTDIEVNYLIRLLLNQSNDAILVELCRRFIYRDLPKCIFDSTKHKSQLNEQVVAELGGSEQLSLLDDELAPSVLEKVRSIVADGFASGIGSDRHSRDLSQYLVYRDMLQFPADPPMDFMFEFADETVSFREIVKADPDGLGAHLAEPFSILRVFAPAQFRERIQDSINPAGRRN